MINDMHLNKWITLFEGKYLSVSILFFISEKKFLLLFDISKLFSGVFIVNFEHNSHLVLVFILLTLNMLFLQQRSIIDV